MKNLSSQWFLVLGLVLAVGAAGCPDSGGSVEEDAAPDIISDGVLCLEDAECDDGNPCTKDKCTAGACEWIPADNTCDDDDPCTTDDMCTDGECGGVIKVCDDEVYCNGLEACNPVTGACEDGAAPEIDDGVECTLDECDEDDDKVVHVPNDAICDDVNPCTSNVCDETLGCVDTVLDGEDCEDGSLCTADDVCDGDTCVGVPVDCDDGEFCNGLETCDPDTGDCADGEAPELDDGLDCTVDDCDEDGDAVTHEADAELCDDGNSCTVDTCDIEQGCLSDTLGDGEACDDDNECTEDDICEAGLCLPGKFICVEDCDNEADDDQDDLVDCADDDCALDMACQPGGDLCGEAFDLTLGVPLTADDEGAVIQFFGTTVGKTNVFAAACDSDTAAAADTVHKVELAAPLGLQLSADFDGGAWAALYVLNDACTEDLICASMDSSDATTLTVVLQPGTYFIAVDGAYPGDVGTYGLEVEVFLPSDTETECGDGVDNDADGLVDCDDDECFEAEICNILTGETCEDALPLADAPLTADAAGTEIVVDDTTAGLMDDVAGSCVVDLEIPNTPDLIYTFELTDPLVMSASFDFAGNKWPALTLFATDCMAENELSCVTAKSEAAVITQGLPAGVYFLVLDASYDNDAGPFTLTVTFDAVPETEVDCVNGIDDDLNGLVDCDDEACGEDPLCVGFDGDNCAKPFTVNGGLPITAELYGETITIEGTTDGLQDFYGACAPGAVDSPDAVYSLVVQDPVVVYVTHDFADDFWPALYAMGEDCDPTMLLGCDTANSGAAELELALPVGSYFFVVDAKYAGDAGPYTFELTFTAPPQIEVICYDGTDNDVDGTVDCADEDCLADLYCLDLYEPNDTLETAYDLGDLSNGVFVTDVATVSPADMDVDHFEFSVLGDHTLNITLTPFDGLDGKVTILDADGITLISADVGGINALETLQTTLTGGGTYFVWVTGYGITEGPYELSVDLTALTEYDCGNGDDEDGDDLVDCCDDDCSALPVCAFEAVCVDGKDNDCDGLIDCEDDDCMATAACGAGDTCEDALLVNDGVGLDASYDGMTLEYWGTTIGYADDFSSPECDPDTVGDADAVWELTIAETVAVNIGMDYMSYMYPAVYITNSPCGEGDELECATAGSGTAWIEGLVLEPGTYYVILDGSWPGDEEVYQLLIDVTAVYETEVDCGDGQDNDFDGLVDCCDDDCLTDEACMTETVCDDGVDNDCDGAWDCGDADCALVEGCAGEGCPTAIPLNDGTAIKQADDGLTLEVFGDTSEAQNDHAGSCDVVTGTAKDLVYTFDVAEAIGVTITHDFDTSYMYPAVYLFGGDCLMESEMACAGGATSDPAVIMPLALEPGTYFVVVDSSYPSDAGTFTLTLEFASAAATETDCHDGIDNDLNGLTDCADPECLADEECAGEVCETALPLNDGVAITTADSGLQIVAQGDTSLAAPDYGGTCSDPSAAANDLVYTFTLAEAMGVQVLYDFDDSYYWPAVYVYDGGCTEEFEVGCAAETTEPALIDAMVYEAGTYYIVVDANYTSDSSEYTLTVAFMIVDADESDCADGMDNDLDGLTDCCDDECFADEACLAELLCGDGLDNDCDGAADCADADCVEDAVCEGDSCAIPVVLNGGMPLAEDDLPAELTETGDTSTASAAVSGSCDDDTITGKDQVYELLLDTPASVSISHDFDGNMYPAVYIFGGPCEAEFELACATAGMDPAVIEELDLEEGAYYIVVDTSYSGDAGTFTLTVTVEAPVDFEDDCLDGADNDGDELIDCDDDDCGVEICGPEQLPYLEDMNFIEGEPIKGGIWGSTEDCGWALTAVAEPEPNGYAEFAYGVGCSELVEDTYWIVGAILDVQACAEISVTFDESGAFSNWAVSHSLGLLDGFAVADSIELPLGILSDEWVASGPHLFDVSALDFVRVGAGYLGNDADTWRVDNFAVECTATQEVCDDEEDNDGDEAIDCADDDCADFIGCLGETCEDSIPLTDAPVALADAGLQVVMTGDTTGHTSEYEGSCDPDTLDAADLVYAFEITDTLYVSVSHDFDGTSMWAAAYLFGDTCEALNELGCAAVTGGAAEFGLTLDPGIYYIIVDASWFSDVGPYTLTVDFATPPPTEETGLCDDGVDNDLDDATDCCDEDCATDTACLAETLCGDGMDNDCDGSADCADTDCFADALCEGESCAQPFLLHDTPIAAADSGLEIIVTGDTSDSANNYTGTCSSGSGGAKDVVYSFTLTETMEVSGAYDFIDEADYLWPAGYLYYGLCEDIAEVACDTATGASAAVLEGSLPAGTYFIVLDADFSSDAGPYSLTMTFTAPPPETEVGLCTDGEDNDLDDLVDCLDVDDCAADPGCGDDDDDGVVNHLDACDLGSDTVDVDENQVPDACQVEWAGDVWPNSGSEHDVADAIDVYVLVYMAGITDAAADAGGAGIEVNLVYKSSLAAEPTTVAMAYNQDIGNNDEFKAAIPADATVSGEAMDVSFEVYYVSGDTMHQYDGVIEDQANITPVAYAITGEVAMAIPIFSEYVEGSSNNKALEVLNLGPDNLDLTTCGVNIYFNESADAGASYDLTDAETQKLAADAVWVICHTGFDAATIDTYCDYPIGAMYYNGDDVVELVCDGVTEDIIGKFQEDPGIDLWGTGDVTTKDDTIRRKCTVTEGDTDGTDVFDPADEWDGFAKDTFDNLGINHCI